MKRHFFKRTAVMLLVLLMAFSSLFTACKKQPDASSSSSESQQESTSKTSSAGTIKAYIYAVDEERSAWNKVIESFENSGDISVDAVIGPDVAEKLRLDILSGKIPDVVYLPSWDGSGVTEALIADKALAPLDGITLNNADNTYCKPYGDGKAYIAPVGQTVYGVWYDANKVTSVPKDIAGIAAYPHADDAFVIAFAGKDADSLNGLFVATLLASADVSTADRVFSGDASVWDDAKVKSVLSGLAALSADGIVHEDSYGFSQGDVVSALAEGSAAFGVLADVDAAVEEAAQAARIAEADASYEGVKSADIAALKLTFLPIGSGSYARFGDLYIPAESKNIEFAKKFVAYITSADMSALNGGAADASGLYSYRSPEELPDLGRRIINMFTSLLYGDTAADAFAKNMKIYVDQERQQSGPSGAGGSSAADQSSSESSASQGGTGNGLKK